MSDPTPPAEPSDPKADPKAKPKPTLEQFVTPPTSPPEPDSDTSGAIDDLKLGVDELKKELEKEQKKNYQNSRKQALNELSTLNPELAEESKSKKLSELEVILSTAKKLSPKFPVTRNEPQNPEVRKGNYYDRNQMKWV